MKNIRKFELIADKDAAVLEEYSVSYVNEENKVYTTPENGGQGGDTVKNYMRFVAVEDSQIKLNAMDYNNWGYVEPTVNLMVNKNMEGWTEWDFTPISLSAGETLYMKGNNQNGFSVVDMENWIGVYYSFGDVFKDGNGSTGKFECHGNIMSLLYGDEFEDKTTIPSMGCFFNLFYHCEGLLTAPELPATTLTSDCYQCMFDSCTSLIESPVLPATELAPFCYFHMFWGCTSLSTAPELPATILASQCYNNMFRSCTSLTTAPELPATTLAERCYESMFGGCISLTTAPELPATTLDTYCYSYMFFECTNLTTAPSILPATTLAEFCYSNMFDGCRSLTTAPGLPATTLADNCYENMFSTCKSLTTAPELPATTLAQCCYMGMFTFCENLTTAPELPATTLESDCYQYMFDSCTSLTESPVLPATELAPFCYFHMFWGCTNLSKITMLATDISAQECLTMWTGMIDNETDEEVSGVAPTGVFVKDANMDNLPIGNQENRFSGIPEGWVIEDYKLINELTSLTITADDVSFNQTRTKIYYTAVGNYRDENGVLVEENITVTGQALSAPFPTNDSYTEDVVREISFTYLGVTATATITQHAKPVYYGQYLTFEALEDGTFSFDKDGTGDDIQYSKDNGTTWTPLASNETINVVSGDKVMWKSTITPNYNGIGNFSSSNRFNAYGNTMSLLYGDDFNGQTSLEGKNCAFDSLFMDNVGLIDASNLILPATTLASNCYNNMFHGCSVLTTAPELPATTLTNGCYQMMFARCTSLTTAPSILPATTLTEYCYMGMFGACVSLNSAPELPSKSLSPYCYNFMFADCSGLTKAPELPATTLTDYCYSSMFASCTNLTTAPELPATTLANSCYYCMFAGCTNLTTVPDLPATTLADVCYSYMFNGCTSLIEAPELPATTLASTCYSSMFYKCTSLTTAPELPATTLADRCYDCMFTDCESLTTAPELPATTLADRCYQSMFAGCISLTNSPKLPATTLTYGCYMWMFDGCTNLNHIAMLATDITAKDCLVGWVSNVSSTGTFVKHPDMTSLPTGDSGIPNGWEVKKPVTPTECTSLTITANNVRGYDTTTTIHYIATCKGVDYKGDTVTGIVEEGTAVSAEFPQNLSETETIERTITFEFMGVTASTTITQGVWVPQSYTIDLNNQWQLSSTISNPDSTLYDGVYQSFSNKGVDNSSALMYIDIFGYSSFKFYVRSYAESNYDFVVVSNLDCTLTSGTTSGSDVKMTTKGNQNSGTSIESYQLVEFTGIDGGEHRITVMYRKDSSSNSGDDRGYVLIPKNQ